MARNVLVAAAAVILLSLGAASALELGVPFGFGQNTTFGAVNPDGWGHDIGVRLHISGVFALQPTISIGLSDNANVGVNLDALFYLFESNGIRQYLGGNAGFNIEDGGGGNFRVGGIYGLQRELVPSVDIFGQAGLGVRFDPSRIYTVNTQLGVIFYILK